MRGYVERSMPPPLGEWRTTTLGRAGVAEQWPFAAYVLQAFVHAGAPTGATTHRIVVCTDGQCVYASQGIAEGLVRDFLQAGGTDPLHAQPVVTIGPATVNVHFPHSQFNYALNDLRQETEADVQVTTVARSLYAVLRMYETRISEVVSDVNARVRQANWIVNTISRAG